MISHCSSGVYIYYMIILFDDYNIRARTYSNSRPINYEDEKQDTKYSFYSYLYKREEQSSRLCLQLWVMELLDLSSWSWVLVFIHYM